MSTLHASLHPRILEELERLCTSEAFARSQTLARLLRHLVVRHLAGDRSALREAAIALEVFRRDPAVYDPQTDPIVRVTASRLRTRLTSHYAREGTRAGVRIVLRKGRYVPEFEVSGEHLDDAEGLEGRTGLAVLATRNATGDASYDAFCAAFAECVADGLANLGVPRVIAQDSVQRARARTPATADIGRELAVEWLLDSILAAEPGGELRLTTRLVSTRDAGVRWTETVARAPAARFAMRDVVSDRVFARFAEALAGAPHGARRREVDRLPADARTSLDLARFLVRQRSPESVARALAIAEELTARYPASAATWALLGSARFARRCFMDSDSVALHEEALAAACRALQIDPEDVTAGATEAAIVGHYRRDPGAAIQRFRDLLRRAPHHSDARCGLAALLHYVGEFDAALHELSLALAHDPLSPFPRAHRANVLAYARRHAEARVEWQLAVAAGAPRLTATVLAGMNELWAGEHDDAHAHFEAAVRQFPDNPMPAMCRAMLCAATGETARAEALVGECLARFPRVSSYNRAEAAAFARDRPGVLRLLRAAHRERDALLVSVCVDPSFDWLGGDAQFNALLRSWGLPGWRGLPPRERWTREPEARRTGSRASA
jgi:TolB-like protein/Flp pilus assembly protein TadD